ncbi:PREDICTED: fas-binding factor 1-like isoform X2 [Priapulus caudatus]|uniref:Fas-binding factor 1-like isoform X2 n=1 Tax=Priapulus caudatus TaxID=37621 RepID=A0ABM1DUA2_PRICU|nr:PREDICTED: fas-binding factor 1-like isoform X2 [Priapulus caudatus]
MYLPLGHRLVCGGAKGHTSMNISQERRKGEKDSSKGSAKKGKVRFDFDEDDPLAGLLSDDEADAASQTKKKLLTRKSNVLAASAESQQEASTTPAAPSQEKAKIKIPSHFLDDDDVIANKSGDKSTDSGKQAAAGERAKLRKEPSLGKSSLKKQDVSFSDDDDILDELTRPSRVTARQKAEEPAKNEAATPNPRGGKARQSAADFDFDDGDVLGDLGLEDTPPREQERTIADENAKSNIMSELFGTKPSMTVDTPKSATSGKRQFVLDTKYKKSDLGDTFNERPAKTQLRKQGDSMEENFQFGSYMPSAVTNRPSTAPREPRGSDVESKDLLGTPSRRPHTSGMGRRRGDGTDLDWLMGDVKNDGVKTDEGLPTSAKTDGATTETDAKVETDWLGRPLKMAATAGPTSGPSTAPTAKKEHISSTKEPATRVSADGANRRKSDGENATTLQSVTPASPQRGDSLAEHSKPHSQTQRQDSNNWRGTSADTDVARNDHLGARPTSLEQPKGEPLSRHGPIVETPSLTTVPTAAQADILQTPVREQHGTQVLPVDQGLEQQTPDQVLWDQYDQGSPGILPAVLPSASVQQPSGRGRAAVAVGGGSHTQPHALTAELHGFQSRIRQLELERNELTSMLESSKVRLSEEGEAVETSYKKRVAVLEEIHTKRESRLQEEISELTNQQSARVTNQEQERKELLDAQLLKLEIWEKNKHEEIDRLKSAHRLALSELRKDHDDQLLRLNKIREQEIEAITSVQSHSRSLQHVLDKMDENAQSLGDLQVKVESQHSSQLNDREAALKIRDEQLKLLQGRLVRQQDDNEAERGRLQQLITRLEVQLQEQAQQLQQERWDLTKEQNRLKTLQVAVDNERSMLHDSIKKERADIQKSKDALLEEQKTILTQLYDERRSMANERTQLSSSQGLLPGGQHELAIKSIKSQAEHEAVLSDIARQKQELIAKADVLERETERLNDEKRQIQQQKRHLEEEQRKLENLSEGIKKRSEEIEELGLIALSQREEAEAANSAARNVEAEQSSLWPMIQAQMEVLRGKEKHLAKEKLDVIRQQQELERRKGDMLVCSSCRVPIRDRLLTSTVDAAVSDAPKPARNPFDMDSITAWKLNSDKDKDFLEQEMLFLEALQYSTYHNPSQAS